ncbi:MAG: hypothetical protein HY510_04570 [Acidobacteria bacterium]|nr:hypothetical protein [Acidobacteriota bacterium]
MTPARMRLLVPGVLICGSLFLHGAASAQSALSVDGALSLTGVEDDNLFSTPGAGARDRISRLTPQVGADYRSARLSLAGRYAFDAERYAEHPELDTSRARQHLMIDLSARSSRRVTLSVHGDYLTTLTPGGDLNLATGLAAGRARARRREVRPSIEWRSGPVTGGSVTYTQTLDDLAGGVASETRAAALEIERRTSPRNTGSLRLGTTRFEFDAGAITTAHVLSFGWERDLGRGTGLELRGGPRFSEGRLDPELTASVRGDFKTMHVALTCARGLATVIGRAGAVMADSVLPSLAYQPRPWFRVSASPGYFRIRDERGGPEAKVYLADLQATWHLGDRLSLVGGYRRSLERGALDPPAPGAGDAAREIAHDTILLTLVARQGGRRAKFGVVPPVK